MHEFLGTSECLHFLITSLVMLFSSTKGIYLYLYLVIVFGYLTPSLLLKAFSFGFWGLGIAVVNLQINLLMKFYTNMTGCGG